MRLRREEREDAQINLTPLIDVVFLLLIFFMVSTTFERESQIELELPEARADRPERESERVEIAIDAEGRVHLEGRRLEDSRFPAVKAALEALAIAPPRPALSISAHAGTPYQSVITVMDAASHAGFASLSLPVRAPRE